ncbi:MAG: VCBS repeat-containing protein [Saprospiraceae bacterium]
MNQSPVNLLFIFTLCLTLLLFHSCKQDNAGKVEDSKTTNTTTSSTNTSSGDQRFQRVDPSTSGVSFSNAITEDYTYNVLNFEYLYNGGGVAVGDINNDGLPDLYFTGTFVPNKLYLNKGNMVFEDITQSAGVAAADGFKTGVTMADVNSDGYLDIYVCRTSKEDDGKKNNFLFINNKDNTFTESAAQFGLVDNANSNHGNFFDYDKDGDLDLFLLNHRLGFKVATKLRLKQNEMGQINRLTNPLTPFESDRLYRNDNGKFVEVSKQAGIDNSAFGLSATIGDINKDGYPDVYVANDYVEPDLIYINNGDGTFTDEYDSYVRHSSQNTMGSDLADINNDGLLDIITLDMIAEDPIRYKQLMNIMQLERYETLLKYGYGHQVSRNVLQLNNGNGTFSEIGQLAGVSNTDWSWGAIFADFDNDGLKDLFIDNGYKRDVTDLDYMTYVRDSIEKSGGVNKKRYPDIEAFLTIIPSLKLQNYIFKNKNGTSFENVSDSWGLTDVSFSNGCAYADLDADGDLDLIVNNISDPAFIYENLTNNLQGGNYLQLQMNGSAGNKLGIGTKVTIRQNDESMQYQELTNNRGFFSASEPILHFGLGENTTVSKVEVVWPDGKSQALTNVKANQKVTINYTDAKNQKLPAPAKSKSIFKSNNTIAYRHVENEFSDFTRERLLPHKLSQEGPALSKADVNGDGLPDCYIGGAANSAGALYLQTKNSKFKKASEATWNADKNYEDISSVFFDADGDKDMDLYIVSGGYVAEANSNVYQDRLYLNDGKGNFSRSNNIPTIRSSGGCVSAHDVDGDGDSDLIVGGRVSPEAYPMAPQSYILKNNGGTFTDATDEFAPGFKNIGMVTDIIWTDTDGDGSEEMIVAGEWMPITIYNNKNGKLNARTLANTNGWWNCLIAADFDGDGDMDLVGGNLGANTRLKASPDAPIRMYTKDFDQNGAIDPIMTFHSNGKDYPYAGRDAMIKQIAKVKKKFTRYYKYADASLEEVLSPEELKDAYKLEANNLLTGYFENTGGGNFTFRPLPDMAQIAPCHSSIADDFNKDGKLDLLLVGNDNGAETETGVYDASNGTLLLGDGKGNFEYLPNREHGLWASNQARDIILLPLADGRKMLVVGNNNGVVDEFVYAR